MRTQLRKSNIKKLKKWENDQGIDLWSLDEVHFQQYGSRCRMWVPPEEKDPVVFHHPGRRSVGYFGAVRIRDGKFVYLRETGKFDGSSFLVFMKHLWKTTSKTDRRTIVITDNARYHHAKMHQDWRKDRSTRMAFDFLPPYSPELNPIERLWKLTRRLCLHNRYFPTLDDVVAVAENQFGVWSKGNDTVRRLCAIT